MQTFSLAVLSIGLIFNILIIMFVTISVLLIYSLLMITTETKTFDYGVMRLIGLNSNGFVAMILIQAVMFVIPSIICAFIFSAPSLKYLWSKMFDDDTGYTLSVVPSTRSCVMGLAIGILIPAFSAIIPISRSLSKSLNDSLNVGRMQVEATVIKITGGSKAKILPYFFFGLLCVVAGSLIYILLPQALLSLNLQLLLDIFFMILLGLIFGLTLITVNFRGFLEYILVYVLLFWERSSMRVLLRKNLIAHKRTNQLTSIIYALTLGTIIFLIVAARIETQLLNSFALIDGVDLVVTGELRANYTDPILLDFASSIADFGMITPDLSDVQGENFPDADEPDNIHFKMTSAARLKTIDIDVFGLTPSPIFEFPKYIGYQTKESGLNPID